MKTTKYYSCGNFTDLQIPEKYLSTELDFVSYPKVKGNFEDVHIPEKSLKLIQEIKNGGGQTI